MQCGCQEFHQDILCYNPRIYNNAMRLPIISQGISQGISFHYSYLVSIPRKTPPAVVQAPSASVLCRENGTEQKKKGGSNSQSFCQKDLNKTAHAPRF